MPLKSLRCSSNEKSDNEGFDEVIDEDTRRESQANQDKDNIIDVDSLDKSGKSKISDEGRPQRMETNTYEVIDVDAFEKKEVRYPLFSILNRS